MFRYPDETYKAIPPATVEYNGYIRNFNELTREQWDELGYNEAVPLTRPPYTSYVTQWVRGSDLIYREEIVSAVVDDTTRRLTETEAIRVERDEMLSNCDWTQLGDAPLEDEVRLAWAEYRQELRNVPQQAGFPDEVDWPGAPE